MPFNASGTYTLSDQIANATPADAPEVQAIFDDIEDGLNLAFLRDGTAIATGQFLGIAGAAPQYSISGDANTGFGSDTADEAYVKAGGVKTLAITATGGTVTGTFAVTGLATLATLAVTSTSTFSDTITSTSASAGFVGYEAICTEAGAAAGPIVSLYRNSSTPAASDIIGGIQFNGKDSGGNKTRYAYIVPTIEDPTDGSEDVRLTILGMVGGAEVTLLDNLGAQIRMPGSLAVTGNASAAGGTFTGALSGASAAGAMLASQGDQGTSASPGSSTSKVVQPGVQQFHPSAAKFFDNLRGTGTIASRDSYNITSETDNGTGDYTFTIATDFSTSSYIVTTCGRSAAAGGDAMVVIHPGQSPTSGAIRMSNLQKGSDTMLDSDVMNIVGFGDQ